MLVVAVLLSFSTSFAQQLPADKAGHKADYLYSKLNLDKDQYTKVYQSLLTYETKVKDLKGNNEGIKKLQTEQNTELGKIFTKDQSAKYDGVKDKMYKQSFKKKNVVKKEGVEEKVDAKKEAVKEKKESKKEAKDMKKEEKKDASKKEVNKDTKK